MRAEARPAFWHPRSARAAPPFSSLRAEPLKLPREEQRDVSVGGQHPPSSLLFDLRAKLATERPGSSSPAAGQHPRQLLSGDGDPRRPDLRASPSACREGRRARGVSSGFPRPPPGSGPPGRVVQLGPSSMLQSPPRLYVIIVIIGIIAISPRQIALCIAAASCAHRRQGKPPEERVGLPWSRCPPQTGLWLYTCRYLF